MKNEKQKYYLINNHYALITNFSMEELKNVLKNDFDIEIYDIKKLTFKEYCSWINENDNIKTTTKFY